MNKEKQKAIKRIKELEDFAKERYIDNTEWSNIIDELDYDEKKELNKCHLLVYGDEYFEAIEGVEEDE